MPAVCPKLVNVRELSIMNLEFEHLPHSVPEALMTSFSSVTRLVIQDCLFETARQITTFLTSFPRLTELTLAGSYAHKPTGKQNETETAPPVPQLHLSYLSLDIRHSDALQWLTGDFTVLVVDTIRISFKGICVYTAITKLLCNVGHSLKHLSLDPSITYFPPLFRHGE
jgi:hypothetical protein